MKHDVHFSYATTVLLIVSFVNVLSAQSMIQHQGTIVTISNETLSGTIEYLDQSKSPSEIKFINGASSVAYDASQVKEVIAPGKTKFVSTLLKYPINPHKLDEITESKELIWEEKNVFLRSLVEGEVSLYELIDERGKKHFVIYTPEEGYVSLILLKYLEDRKLATASSFRNQLKRAFDNVDDFYTDINRTNYTQSHLVKLIEKYHKKQGSSISYKSPSQPFGIEFSIRGGVSATNHILNQVKTVSSNVKPNIEINIDYIMPKYNRNWSFFTGLGFKSYEVPLVFYNRGTEQLNYIKLFTGVRKRLFDKKAYFSFGMSNANLMNKVDDEMRTYEVGVFLGAGLRFGKLSLNLRSEISNGYSRSFNYSTVVKSRYLTIGYVFAEKNN